MWLLGCAFAVAMVVTAGSFGGFEEGGKYRLIFIRCGKPLMLKIYNSRTVNAKLNLPHMHLKDDVFIRNGKLTAFALASFGNRVSFVNNTVIIRDMQTHEEGTFYYTEANGTPRAYLLVRCPDSYDQIKHRNKQRRWKRLPFRNPSARKLY